MTYRPVIILTRQSLGVFSGLTFRVQKFPVVHSFNALSKSLLGTHYIQGTVLGSENTEMRRDNKRALLEPLT